MTDDRILMRLALDEASAAADRGDPGSAPSWLEPARPWPKRAVRRSPIAIRSPTAGSPFSARRAVGWAAATSAAAGLWHRRIVSNVQRSTAADQHQPDRARCSGSALADLLGPRAFLIEDLAVDYAVQPQVERGLESEASLAILARSLTDHPSEHG